MIYAWLPNGAKEPKGYLVFNREDALSLNGEERAEAFVGWYPSKTKALAAERQFRGLAEPIFLLAKIIASVAAAWRADDWYEGASCE